MKRLEREVLLKLIIFCEKSNYSVKEVYIRKGSMLEPHLAKVLTDNNKEYILEYFICNGDWREALEECGTKLKEGAKENE